MDERGRDQQSLPHAFGAFGNRAIACRGEIEHLEQLVGATACQGPIQVMQRGDELELFAGGQRFIERARLGDVADPPFDLEWRQGHIETGDHGAAGVGTDRSR